MVSNRMAAFRNKAKTLLHKRQKTCKYTAQFKGYQKKVKCQQIAGELDS